MNKRIYDIILGPISSEKTVAMEERENTFSFWVRVDATKPEIREAVQSLFKVKVRAVHTVRMRPSNRSVGRRIVQGSARKKAYVTLQAGDKIQLGGEN